MAGCEWQSVHFSVTLASNLPAQFSFTDLDALSAGDFHQIGREQVVNTYRRYVPRYLLSGAAFAGKEQQQPRKEQSLLYSVATPHGFSLSFLLITHQDGSRPIFSSFFRRVSISGASGQGLLSKKPSPDPSRFRDAIPSQFPNEVVPVAFTAPLAPLHSPCWPNHGCQTGPKAWFPVVQ